MKLSQLLGLVRRLGVAERIPRAVVNHGDITAVWEEGRAAHFNGSV